MGDPVTAQPVACRGLPGRAWGGGASRGEELGLEGLPQLPEESRHYPEAWAAQRRCSETRTAEASCTQAQEGVPSGLVKSRTLKNYRQKYSEPMPGWCMVCIHPHTLQDTREDPQRALLWEWEKLATDHVLLWFHQTFISWEDPKGSNLSKGLNCFPEQAFIRNRTWAMLSDAKIHVWSLTLERSGRRCNPDEIKIDQWKSTKNYTHHGVIKQGYKSSFYNCLPHMQGVRGQRDMPRENLQWKL